MLIGGDNMYIVVENKYTEDCWGCQLYVTFSGTKEECEKYCVNSGIDSEYMKNIIHCIGRGKQDIYLGGYIE